MGTARYWAVTSIDYIHHRNPSRIITMIVLIWLISLLISVSPLFGWKDPGWYERLEKNHCLVSQSVSYQIFGTLSSFYVPLAVILFLYYRIYETARKRIRRRPTKAPTGLLQPETTTTTSLMNSPSPEKAQLLMRNGRRSGSDSVSTGPTPESTPMRVIGGGGGAGGGNATVIKTKRETTESKRERKAAKTLAIITGVFIICWLPFFVMALIMPLCPHCPMSDAVASVLLWLGYFNSTLNPVIYNIFNPEFRQAFKKILFGRHYATRGGSGGAVAV